MHADGAAGTVGGGAFAGVAAMALGWTIGVLIGMLLGMVIGEGKGLCRGMNTRSSKDGPRFRRVSGVGWYQ